jgi:DNA-binding MarR family transcriptional regulator
MDALPTAVPPLAPDDPRLGAWRAFLLSHARVSRRLDDELRAAHDLSLAEYDALLQIAHAPGRRLRMSQLAERVLLSRSGVTRLIDRLVADDFVVRGACPSDARGAEAVLTDAGLARLRDAARTHLQGIERYFLAAVPDDELEVVERALRRVADRAEGDAGNAPPRAERETAGRG